MVFLGGWTTQLPAVNLLINPDFVNGLADWQTFGGVTEASQTARLQDDSPSATLYQTVAIGPGIYALEFDINLAPLANQVGVLGRDLFSASLYFGDHPATLDPVGAVFTSAEMLFDADATQVTLGPLPESATGGLYEMTVSPLGGPWLRFSGQLTILDPAVALTFDLTGLNGVAGDSVALIDNASLILVQAIPEPSRGGLWAVLTVAASSTVWRRRRLLFSS